jgi:hypothetical protein
MAETILERWQRLEALMDAATATAALREAVHALEVIAALPGEAGRNARTGIERVERALPAPVRGDGAVSAAVTIVDGARCPECGRVSTDKRTPMCFHGEEFSPERPDAYAVTVPARVRLVPVDEPEPAGDEDMRLREGLAAAWQRLVGGDPTGAQRVLEVVMAGGDVPAGGDELVELLTSDEAVEAWLDACRELPRVFDEEPREVLRRRLRALAARLSSTTKEQGDGDH